MAITLRGISVNPDDLDGLPGPTVSVATVASMAAGDLCIIVSQQRTTADGAPMEILETGGQTWTSEGAIGSPDHSPPGSVALFWCRFNGTWTANPSVTFTTGTMALTVAMIVFIPTTATNSWLKEHEQTFVEFAAPGGAGTVTITTSSRAFNHANNVSLAFWATPDDNTWTNTAGTGWSLVGAVEQYRNTQGLDQSIAFAYRIGTAIGAPNNVSKDQGTTAPGPDAGHWNYITFFELAASVKIIGSTKLIGSVKIV